MGELAVAEQQLSKEEVERMVRQMFEDLDAIPIGELQAFIDSSYEYLEAEGIPTTNVDQVLRPFRERLFAERRVIYEVDLVNALEDLANDGYLERRGVNELSGDPVYRRRKPS